MKLVPVLSLLLASISAVAMADTWITFGFLRMTGVDSPSSLAGYLTAINEANTKSKYNGLKFRMNVTTIPCNTSAYCSQLSAADDAKYVQTFMSAMPQFTAVFKPNYFLAPRIIDQATALGGLPVIEPGTIRSKDYAFDPMTWFNASAVVPPIAQQVNTSQHIFNFKQHFRGSMAHIYTYMQQTSGCSYSGIIYEDFSDMRLHVSFMQSLFASGGLPIPPALNVLAASDAALVDFFISDNRRTCFVVMTGHATFMDTVRRLVVNTYFDPSENQFYGSRLMADDFFTIDIPLSLQNLSAPKKTSKSVAANTDNAFTHTFYVQWFPSHNSTLLANEALLAAFADWTSVFDNNNYNGNYNGRPFLHTVDYIDYIPVVIMDSTLEAYLIMNFMMECMQSALVTTGIDTVANAAAAGALVPIPWSAVVDAYYDDSRSIGGYPFTRGIRTCPPQPMQQLCYCNTVTRTSYLYKVVRITNNFLLPDGLGGFMNLAVDLNTPQVVYDDVSFGQRNVATLEFPTTCTYAITSWSYPITATLYIPTVYVEENGLNIGQVREEFAIIESVFLNFVYTANYGQMLPPRPFRFGAVYVAANEDLQTVLDYSMQLYNPFVNIGSLQMTTKRSGTTLTLMPSITSIQTEDPELVPHDQWRWELINLVPVLADLIHALVSYYSESMSIRGIDQGGGLVGARTSTVVPYTGLRSIATSRREAELIALSFNSFGVEYYPEDVIVTTDYNLCEELTTSWVAELGNPFILVASTNNTNDVLHAAYAGATSVKLASLNPLAVMNKGTIAIATSENIFHSFYTEDPTTDNATYTAAAEVIFASFLSEWWTPAAQSSLDDAQLLQANDPIFWFSKVVMDFTNTLVQQVLYDYVTSAATMLYTRFYISVAIASFGPFYNTTCSAQEIQTNEKDRRCQCTKGVRNLFVHSVHDWDHRVPSGRTGRFSYILTTCGVKYFPYIFPPSSRSLSSGAIAGIAVGCSVAFLGAILAIFLVNLLCLGRNNRGAPKDASQPFAIVFTDIQSSTALWARAPAAMSEAVDQHHRLMRKVLRSNRGYEVKTVGDSFMVAFKDANDAVTFAVEAQTEFNSASWSDEIDAIYIELMAENGIQVESAGHTYVPDSESIHGSSGVALDPLSINLAARSHNNSTVDPNLLGKSADPKMMLNVSTGNVSGSPSGVEGIDKPSQKVLLARSSVAPSVASEDYRSRRTGVGRRKTAVNPWHGVRVRIGVHYGMGDIRKDPVSLGYDYYGTVVNTAARVEGVGHGGQILVTDAAYDALADNYARDHSVTVISLGPQPLRGLDAPLVLHQFVPGTLEARRFPPLRLHIEKADEEDESTERDSGTGTNTSSYTPEDVAARLCETKQFKGLVTAQELLYNFSVLHAVFAPTDQKYKTGVIAKLGESWGFEKASKDVKSDRLRAILLVRIVGKVTTNLKATMKRGQQRDQELAHHNALFDGSSMRSQLTTSAQGGMGASAQNNNISLFNHHAAASTRSEGATEGGVDITALMGAGREAITTSNIFNFHPSDNESAVGGASVFGTSADQSPMPIGGPNGAIGRGSTSNASPITMMGSGSIFNSNLNNGGNGSVITASLPRGAHLSAQALNSNSNSAQHHVPPTNRVFRTGSGASDSRDVRGSIDVIDANSANNRLPNSVLVHN